MLTPLLDTLKHRIIFKSLYNSRYYKYFWCAIALYISIAPVLVLEDPRDIWQLTHYNIVESLNLLLLLDAILILVFMGTSVFKNSYFYVLDIFTSVSLIVLGILSDFLVPKPPLTFEQSNPYYFLLYSILCVSKIFRIFFQILNELP